MFISTVSGFECDGDFSGLEVEQGGWGYYPIICDIEYESIEAGYVGDLSDKIDVMVFEEDSYVYRIALIIDAVEVEDEEYEGKVNLYGVNGSKFATFDVVFLVGEGEVERISLSETRLRFFLEKEDSEECYEVSVENSGNVELNDLRVRVDSWDDDCKWIEISGIGEDDEDFGVGEREELKVCVNNRANCRGWNERNTEVWVETKEVSKRIKVTLMSDEEVVWKEKYGKLKDEHDFLWGTYRKEHGYMLAWGPLNRTHSSLVENYSLLQGEYSDVSARYDKLFNENKVLMNYSREVNESLRGEIAVLEREVERSVAAVGELNEQLTDKDVLLTLIEQKYANLSGGMPSGNEATPEVVGNILGVAGNQSGFMYMGVALVLLLAAAFVASVTVRNRRRREIKPALAGAKAPAGSSLFEEHREGEKELQKEKLKKLLMEKLAEKSSKGDI